MDNIVYEKLSNFQWGPIHSEMKELLTKEFFSDKKNVYEKYNEVKKNDIVVDLGSSIGPFGYQIKDRDIKKLYCVEPSLEEIDTLKKNLEGVNYSITVSAIGNNDNEIVTGMVNRLIQFGQLLYLRRDLIVEDEGTTEIETDEVGILTEEEAQ